MLLTLTKYAALHGHTKYDWYFPFYDELLQPHRFKSLRLLEIGCSARSLRTWIDCLPNAQVVGLDRSAVGGTGQDDLPAFARSTPRLRFVLGDQTDVELLDTLGEFDFIIDDGGHTMHQQQVSLRALFPKLRSDGWYVIEDTHTSYMEAYTDKGLTTLSVVKSFIDEIHADWNTFERTLPIKELRVIDSLIALQSGGNLT